MRKLFIILLTCFVVLTYNSMLNAQETLQKKLADIKGKITEIQIDKSVIKQSIEIKDESKGKLLYTSSETDGKGKTTSESYEFYLSDIDKNTIVRKPSGKKMLVSLSTTNGLKFIRHLKEDQLDGYVNNFSILAENADQAKDVSTLLSESIPLVKSTGMDWSSPQDALKWLAANIGQVNLQSDKYEQTFAYNADKNYLITFTSKKTDAKSAVTDEVYDFNLLDLNKNELKVNVSGLNLTVTSKTKGGDRYVRETRNGLVQGYGSTVEIRASDIEQARTIINALITAITASKAEFTQYKNISQGLDYLKTSIKEIVVDGKTISQKFDYSILPLDVKASFKHSETDSKGTTFENLFEFYPADVDENSIVFKPSGKKILLSFAIKNKQKFIRYSKDNVLQSYQNDLEIVLDNIEDARNTVDALKYISVNAQSTPVSINNINSAIDFLKKNIAELKVGTDSYKQSFNAETAAPNLCKYSVEKTDTKGVTSEESFEYYSYLIDPNSLKIEASGKFLKVSMNIKNKKSYVKSYKNKVQQSYDDEVAFMTDEVRAAKDIMAALKYMVANAKPEVRDWSNKSKTSSYVTETVGNFTGKGVEIKQKLSYANDDPCKYSLNISSTDDKGKTTEEIYEFNLSDLNKMMVDFKISGKNVNVILVTKNKEKLIKYYKNGAQQSYTSDLAIIEDDVDTGQNLADAFKALIVACEK